MKPYNWMVQYTPQTNWIERRGIVIWLSIYSGILGGGAYLASLFFNNLAGMFISWIIICFVKGGLHIAHAERPLKLWRMVLRPQTSWISRGLILTALLIIFGAIQLILTYTMPGTTAEMIFKVIAGIAAFGVIIYAGFTMNYVSGIPFWNAAILPVCFIFWGILTGVALVLTIGLNLESARLAIAFIVLLSAAILIVTALYLWTETYAGSTARESAKELMRGSPAPVFWVGAIAIGLAAPLIISLISYFSSSAPSQLTAVILLICAIIGGLSFTYTALKAGLYRPIIPNRY